MKIRSERKFKLKSQYPGSVVPLAMISNIGHQVEILELIANLATCISWKLGHQVAQLALVQHLVIRWRHLHCFQSWPPGHVTCIASLPWIALLALSVSIELVSSLARVKSVMSP